MLPDADGEHGKDEGLPVMTGPRADSAMGTLRVLDGKGDQDRVVAIDDGAMAVIQRWIDTGRSLGFRNGRCSAPSPANRCPAPTSGHR